MEDQDEKRLLELAREIKRVERETVKKYIDGKDYHDLEIKFLDLKQKIIELVSNFDYPIKLRDWEVIRTLREIREGNSSFPEKRFERFWKLYNAYDEGKLTLDEESELKKIIEEIKKETENDKQIDDDFSDRFSRLIDEIGMQVGSIERFFDNKREFSNIFVSSSLPQNFHTIFYEIKWCYMLDLHIAVIGLCRIILEIAFRDKYIKYFSNVRKRDNVVDLMEYKVGDMIRKVSRKLGLGKRGEKLYRDASYYLHGRIDKHIDDLKFVHETFKLIEDMYNLG